MKKNALIVCAFMVGLFASCSSEDIQQESVATTQQTVVSREFSVVDENEVSEEQFFNNAVVGIADKADASQLSELNASFKESFAKLENENTTRGFVPAIKACEAERCRSNR